MPAQLKREKATNRGLRKYANTDLLLDEVDARSGRHQHAKSNEFSSIRPTTVISRLNPQS
jgi:hypothetical protein